MKRVLVLGANGMLGAYVRNYLASSKYHVNYTTREEFVVDENISQEKVDKLINDFEPDWVVNCIGMIKPQINKYGTKLAIVVNSLFPHMVADSCEKKNIDFIHITTDCVFNGRDGDYTESSNHNAEDIYGKTKSLGEPENCIVIRTSIIGEEVGSSRSFIEWVKSQKNETVNGFVNHRWNGVTCLQLAKIIGDIIGNKTVKWKGVKHIFANTVTKYELIQKVAVAFNIPISVNRVIDVVGCDRTLGTHNDIIVNVPDIDSQLKELADFSPRLTKLHA
jgi:dTDP-4-dehydrorhamnose reductase